MNAFFSVVRAIARACKKCKDYHKIIVEKSTVPLGTAKELRKVLQDELQMSDGEVERHFSIVSKPEFLAEGSAIRDLMTPQRVVIGTKNEKAFKVIQRLVGDVKIIRTEDTGSSELGKLLSNAFLAQRISSVNSMTELCEKTGGCNINEVKAIIASDERIGSKYL